MKTTNRPYGGEDEEEVLAFIVVESYADDGSVLTHIEAISVQSPMLTYSPFPDEDLSYELCEVQRPTQPAISTPDFTGPVVLADTKTHHAIVGFFWQPIRDSHNDEIALDFATSMKTLACGIDARPGLQWIHYNFSELFSEDWRGDPDSPKKILLGILERMLIGGPPSKKSKYKSNDLRIVLDRITEVVGADFATDLVDGIWRLVSESAPAEFKTICERRGQSPEQIEALWRVSAK